ncbi:MAG: hypothetical protein WC933_00035 [Candidatus Paceibacterota bacterium]|jgi:hypothetical protein
MKRTIALVIVMFFVSSLFGGCKKAVVNPAYIIRIDVVGVSSPAPDIQITGTYDGGTTVATKVISVPGGMDLYLNAGQTVQIHGQNLSVGEVKISLFKGNTPLTTRDTIGGIFDYTVDYYQK